MTHTTPVRAVVLMDGFDAALRPPPTAPHPAFRDVDGLPAADHLLRHLAEQQITHVCMVTHHLAGMVAHYFGNGAAWGLRMEYVYHDGPGGSAGAIGRAAEFVTDTTLLVDGTLLTDVALSGLAEVHRSTGADVTMTLARSTTTTGRRPSGMLDEATAKVTGYEPRGRRNAPTDADAVNAGPDGPELMDAGVYVIEPSVLGGLDSAPSQDWRRGVLPDLVSEERVAGWFADGASFAYPVAGARLALDEERIVPRG